jgi:hypothetical protein
MAQASSVAWSKQCGQLMWPPQTQMIRKFGHSLSSACLWIHLSQLPVSFPI